MDLDVRPIEESEIQSVCELLSTKFGTTSNTQRVKADVLQWKCFDQLGAVAIPRGFVATQDGQIVAYVGLCPVQFVGGGLTQEISVGHGIDWYSSQEVVSAGFLVGKTSDESTDVSIAIGGTDLAVKIRKKLKKIWRFLPPVANFHRSLRPTYHMRPPRLAPAWKCLAKALRDYGRNIYFRRQRPSVSMQLQQVDSFGEEVFRIVLSCQMPEIHINRTPDLLNHFLRYPRKNITGWHIMHNGVVRGFALLSIVQKGHVQTGKIVDCCLDSLDQSLWQAALYVLTEQLHQLSADIAICHGTIPLVERALRANGFICNEILPFAIRDPHKLIPENASFYLTHLIADHAYI